VPDPVPLARRRGENSEIGEQRTYGLRSTATKEGHAQHCPRRLTSTHLVIDTRTGPPAPRFVRIPRRRRRLPRLIKSRDSDRKSHGDHLDQHDETLHTHNYLSSLKSLQSVLDLVLPESRRHTRDSDRPCLFTCRSRAERHDNDRRPIRGMMQSRRPREDHEHWLARRRPLCGTPRRPVDARVDWISRALTRAKHNRVALARHLRAAYRGSVLKASSVQSRHDHNHAKSYVVRRAANPSAGPDVRDDGVSRRLPPG